MTKEIRSRNLSESDFEIRAMDGKNRISGYAIVWNTKSSIGSFDEICDPAMLDRTLRELPDVLLLRDHEQSLLLGRTGKNLTLTVDSKGLRFECDLLDDSQNAMQAYSDIKAQLLTGCSFGFTVEHDSWENQPSGIPLRRLLDVTLYECSVTSFPAYQSTSVDARSIRARMKRDYDATLDTDEDVCDCSCEYCSAQRDMDDSDADEFHTDCQNEDRCELYRDCDPDSEDYDADACQESEDRKRADSLRIRRLFASLRS
jgi:uncharacterized protein